MVFWKATDRASRWNSRSSESDWTRQSYESRTKRKSRHCTLGVGLDASPGHRPHPGVPPLFLSFFLARKNTYARRKLRRRREVNSPPREYEDDRRRLFCLFRGIWWPAGRPWTCAKARRSRGRASSRRAPSTRTPPARPWCSAPCRADATDDGDSERLVLLALASSRERPVLRARALSSAESESESEFRVRIRSRSCFFPSFLHSKTRFLLRKKRDRRGPGARGRGEREPRSREPLPAPLSARRKVCVLRREVSRLPRKRLV